MKEAYVKFETAKLLKEKGFNWECTHYYDDDGTMHKALDYVRQNEAYEDDNDECLCPTQQKAMRWLREKKLHISANIYIDESQDADGVKCDEWTYWDFEIMSTESGRFIEEPNKPNAQYDTYEDAVEAALKYVLTNLI